MSFGAIAVAGIGAAVTISQANQNRQDAERRYLDAKKERDKQQKALDAQKLIYKNMQFKNPFANMENVYEDLTINQQQAEFQQQQAAQTRANIMQGLRGSAGASGIGGLAQSLANQGALQTQRISASIGLQESQNLQMGQATGANLAAQQAQTNQMNAEIATQQLTSGIFSTTASALAQNADKMPWMNPNNNDNNDNT